MKLLTSVLVAAIGLSACSSTVSPTTRNKKTLGTAVEAPLKDLGIVRMEAPKQLSDIRYPYDQARLENGCPQIRYEIDALEKLLGNETYIAPPAKRGTETAKEAAGGAVMGAAESATTGFIPFRGVVRGVTGASARDAEIDRAVLMGLMRRSFLRGYGLANQCDNVLPPGSVPPTQPLPAEVPREQLLLKPPGSVPPPVTPQTAAGSPP
ncbi:MAG: hypothetical protein WDN76_13120 [Alphaproteobacteria bacterium]